MDLIDDTLVEFDLDTLEPTPGTPDQSSTPDQSTTPDQSHRSSPDNLSTNKHVIDRRLCTVFYLEK